MVAFSKVAAGAFAFAVSVATASPTGQSDVAWSGPTGTREEAALYAARDVAMPNESNTTEPAFECYWGRQYGIWDRFVIFAKSRFDVETVDPAGEIALLHTVDSRCGKLSKKSWYVEQGMTNGTLRFDTIIGEANCVDAILSEGAKTHIPCRRRKVKHGELLYDTPGP